MYTHPPAEEAIALYPIRRSSSRKLKVNHNEGLCAHFCGWLITSSASELPTADFTPSVGLIGLNLDQVDLYSNWNDLDSDLFVEIIFEFFSFCFVDVLEISRDEM